MSKADQIYCVYILDNGKGALYTGVTNDLERRLHEHKAKLIKGFTSKYVIDQLLYFEEFGRVDEAIAMEKQIKGWVRKKKLQLIRELNPSFRDLSLDWLTD
jgi:putative endonuclease